MNYYLRKKGLYLTKSKEFVSPVELDKAWGFDMYVAASQTAMKLGGDFEIVQTIEVFMQHLRNSESSIEIFKAGIDEKREKILEQSNRLVELEAANKELLHKLKIEYLGKEIS